MGKSRIAKKNNTLQGVCCQVHRRQHQEQPTYDLISLGEAHAEYLKSRLDCTRANVRISVTRALHSACIGSSLVSFEAQFEAR